MKNRKMTWFALLLALAVGLGCNLPSEDPMPGRDDDPDMCFKYESGEKPVELPCDEIW